MGGGGGQKNLHNSQKLPQISCYQAFSNSILIVLLKKHKELKSPRMIPITQFLGSGSWTTWPWLEVRRVTLNIEFTYAGKNCNELKVAQSTFQSLRIQCVIFKSPMAGKVEVIQKHSLFVCVRVFKAVFKAWFKSRILHAPNQIAELVHVKCDV